MTCSGKLSLLARRRTRLDIVSLSFVGDNCNWHLCKMAQTRVFAASIMMFRERVRRTSSYNWRVDMGTTRKPRKESSKATLARIKKEMAQPASPSLRVRGRQPDKTRSDRVITVSRRSYFLESSRSKRPSTPSRLSLVSTLFNRIE